MVSGIALTSSMRNNLLSLQNTQKLMDTTQERLSSGRKVNSALDNPSSYFTAQALNTRASELTNLLDSMGQGVQTLKAADTAITTLNKFAEQAKTLVNMARDTNDTSYNLTGTATGLTGTEAIASGSLEITVDGNTQTYTYAAGTMADLDAFITAINADTATTGVSADLSTGSLVLKQADGKSFTVNDTLTGAGAPGVSGTAKAGTQQRATYANQFNDILDQMDQMVQNQDTGYKGINLINGQDLKINFNESRTSSLSIDGVVLDTAGLGISASQNDWKTNVDIDAALEQVDAAILTLRNQASEFAQNLSVVQTRQDFTENMISTLTTGADQLTLADMNEEAANMLALQVRQQLGVNALSLASQSQQSVLKLF